MGLGLITIIVLATLQLSQNNLVDKRIQQIKNQSELVQKYIRKISFKDDIIESLVDFRVIKEKEDFLIKNKDYSAVGGNVYSFVYFENKIKIITDRYGFHYRYGVYNLDFKFKFINNIFCHLIRLKT